MGGGGDIGKDEKGELGRDETSQGMAASELVSSGGLSQPLEYPSAWPQIAVAGKFRSKGWTQAAGSRPIRLKVNGDSR